MEIKAVLKEGVERISKDKYPDKTIKELIAKVFASRNAFHFAHWKSQSYSEHMAIGDLYEEIVGKMDQIVEVYQGKYGVLKDVSCPASSSPANLVSHVKAEAQWLGENRDQITNRCEAVSAIIDELEAMYLKTIYKLENLK